MGFMDGAHLLFPKGNATSSLTLNAYERVYHSGSSIVILFILIMTTFHALGTRAVNSEARVLYSFTPPYCKKKKKKSRH